MFRVINPRFIRLISPTPGKISKNANHVHLQASSCRNSMVSQRQSEVAALAKPGKCWTIVLNRVMLYSSSATTKNTGSEFCDDLYKSGISKIESSDFEEGFKLLLRASELGFAPAQVALGQLYLQEDRDDIKQQQEKTTLSMIDEAGKPTGGASSAEEVLAELKQSRKENLRRRNEKQRENKQKSRSTKWKSKEKKEKNENLINITRYQVNKITPKDGEPKLEKNEAAAIRWFSLAAKQGSTDAMVQLGNVLLHRVETEKRQFKNKDVRGKLKEALDWYEKAAAHDPPHPDALYNLGLLYYEGFHDSLEIDPARSFLLIKTAADVCNDPSALFFVGHIGLQGDEKIPKKIIPDDIKYAWNCVKSAADQGHIEAMTYIFKFLLEDRNAERVGVSEEEAEEFAVGYLEKAVQGGGAEAIHIKADMAFGVDNPKALRLYIEAGEAGSAEAWVSAGVMFYQGLGTEISYISAYRAYEQAAQLGSIEAWKNLASLYYNGHGVVKCVETADKIVNFLNEIDIDSATKNTA